MAVYVEFPPVLPTREPHSVQVLTVAIVKAAEAAITTESETEITIGM